MSSNGWKVERLEDICSLITDGKHGDCQNEENSGYFFLSAKDILNGKLNYENARQITKHDFEETNKRTQLEPCDILITNSGTIGRMAFVTNHNFTRRTTFQKSVAILKPIKEKVYPPFLYYCLAARKTDIKNTASGTTQENLLLGDIRKFSISIPESIETQRRIADILSTFDEKIELNRQTNATLEAIAQAIFKEWFVDFNYPGATGEMVDSELGPIPKGWSVTRLGDEGEFKNGVNYSRDESGDHTYSIVNVRNIVGNRYVLKADLDKIAFDAKKAAPYKLSTQDIIIARSASPGEAAILFEPSDDTIFSGFTIRYRVNIREHHLYLFLLIRSIKEKLADLANGTTLKSINQASLKNVQIILPDEKTTRSFSVFVKPIFEEIFGNQLESKLLCKLRDTLLPKLINPKSEERP